MFTLTLAVVGISPASLRSSEPIDQDKARIAMRRVLSFYRQEVGYQGAYLWRYSADLSQREGEGVATRTSGWTQPPGSPSVGEAYLEAWRLCGDDHCLQASVEVARALVRSQLISGGWSSHFDLGKEGRRRYAYRTDQPRSSGRNLTTFDDNKSQSALALLMHVDEALEFRDRSIHEAVEYALDKMLLVQYPNGAWPQQYAEPANPDQYPVKRASYPDSWSRTYPQKDYRGYYTLNDNNMSHIIDMLFEAWRIYGRSDCFDAAKRTGDFFLLAQMPDPQPGWAQQYDRNMHPAWARKFEPASITGGESQSVMRALLTLYRFTADNRYIRTLPKALTYYRKSRLADGRLARFYELRTNKPLYFTKDYQLTYSDADMPTHYGFQVGSNLDSIQRELQELASLPDDQLKPRQHITRPAVMSRRLAGQAEAVIEAIDDRGAWVEDGKMRYQAADARSVNRVIEMKTLVRNLEILAKYVGAISR